MAMESPRPLLLGHLHPSIEFASHRTDAAQVTYHNTSWFLDGDPQAAWDFDIPNVGGLQFGIPRCYPF